MAKLDAVVTDFFQLLSQLRNHYFRPAEQITRMRLSPAQFHLLSLLKVKGPMSMRDLAADLCISKQQLTPLVGKLSEAGYIVRKPDQRDRRVQWVEITDIARDTITDLRAEIKRAFVQRLEVLPEEDLEELGVLLKRIQEILKTEAGNASDHDKDPPGLR